MRSNTIAASGWKRWLAAGALVVALGSACAYRTLTPELREATNPPVASDKIKQLKVHLRSGELCVLESWRLAEDQSRIEGKGVMYSPRREPGVSGPQSIPVADVALLEADSPETAISGGMTTLGVVTTVLGGVTAICVSDPKSCFGSCPTFYIEGDDSDRPAAEGFSASIARALEARDLDALFGARVSGRQLVLTMRNEALETHAIRRVRLLATTRPPGGRVLADSTGVFHAASAFTRPEACQAAEGDCLAAVDAFDTIERSSLADSEDLAARETLELSFPAASGPHGIVIGARQTLLTTFLFYQTMAYLGRNAGETLAALERAGPAFASRAMGMARVLGGIDIEVAEAGGAFRPIGTFDEAGPIAGDVQVVPFEPTGAGALRVRLRLTQGHWRLGWVSLARLGAAVDATLIEPAWVDTRGKKSPAALAALKGAGRHLVTLPGDDYRVGFTLPRPAPELELFLESQGFYYEWMRDAWLEDEDPAMAMLALTQPEEALRRLAHAYKTKEGLLDRGFESSRYRK